MSHRREGARQNISIYRTICLSESVIESAREREKGREKERQRDRETERQRDRETERKGENICGFVSRLSVRVYMSGCLPASEILLSDLVTKC